MLEVLGSMASEYGLVTALGIAVLAGAAAFRRYGLKHERQTRERCGYPPAGEGDRSEAARGAAKSTLTER